MDSQKDTESIFGQMGQLLRVISSKVTGMVMVFGNPREAKNNTKGTIYSIENTDTASTTGEITQFIKGNILKISEQAMVIYSVMDR